MTVPARVPSGEPAREHPLKLRFEDDSGVVVIYESSTTRDGEPLVSIACRGRGARLDRREALQLHEWLYEWLAAVSVPAQEQDEAFGGSQSEPCGGESRVHELKCWPPFFGKVQSGAKPFEVRRNDRDFQVGDVLHLREWAPVEYTGRECYRLVTFLAKDMAEWGLVDGYCILGLASTTRASGSPQDPLSVPLVEPPHEKEEGRMRVPSLELAIDALWLAGRPATGDALRAEVKSLIAERDRLLAPPMEEVSEGESSNTAVQPRVVQSTADRVPWTSRPASDLARVPKGDSPSLTSPLLVPREGWLGVQGLAEEIERECRYYPDVDLGLIRNRAEQISGVARAVLSRLAGDGSEPVLGSCVHGVDLDREFCPEGCRV